MEQLQQGADVFFLLMGAILVFSMHGGFAFLEVGTVRHKNQVNALVKIMVDFAVSTVAYFVLGYYIAYGVHFFHNATVLGGNGAAFDPQGATLVKFFFLCTFAAAVPAIVSGGIAERARFNGQTLATLLLVAIAYPLLEGAAWNKKFGLQENFFTTTFGAEFKDFAGSIVVHAFGGWVALAAIKILGPRIGRYEGTRPHATPPSSLPWLAMGSWMLCIGWFGFNVMSAQNLKTVSGLVAMNSLLAMCGGILSALYFGKNDPGFVHNGALAGLVAVCAGSDIMHPVGSFAVGAGAGFIFVKMFHKSTKEYKIDDVLGVWALHGLCGLWGGIACGIFGQPQFGGAGGVTFMSQLVGSAMGAAYGYVAGYVVYTIANTYAGLRLSPEEEQIGADLAIHKIGANPEAELRGGRG